MKKILKKGSQVIKILLGSANYLIDDVALHMENLCSTLKNIILFIIAIPMYFFQKIKKVIIFTKRGFKFIWDNIKNSFYNTLGILVAIFFVLLFVFFILVLVDHINPSFIQILEQKYILTNSIYDENTSKTLNILISQGAIINASEVYNHMLEYYNTLVTILIALLGVFGFISWFSIQAKIKHDAEISVDTKFESKDFDCRLEKILELKATKVTSTNEYLEKLSETSLPAIIDKLIVNKKFRTLLTDISQEIKDTNSTELQKLEGVEDGDNIQ